MRSASSADVVVVRPAAWASALEAWKLHRESQGFEVAELDTSLGREAIQAAIAELARQSTGELKFVLLAGDVGRDPSICIPTFYYQSTAMVQFGGDPTIASDNPYADVDRDGSPDLAIGRIPADSEEQLRDALQRVIDFENLHDFSAWRRDVHVVAGVGGFGVVADSVIEMTTRRFLADRIPGWSKVTMTQASLQSHYCPDPFRFSECCIDRMNQGGMFWVYIGHGHVKTLDYLRVGRETLPIMTTDHLPAVDTGRCPPIAVFLACYTGAFDALEDSLAEQLVLSKSGPIAALAASRVSGPYGLAMLADGLLSGCFESDIDSLGEIILRAKQRLLRERSDEKPAVAGDQQIEMIRSIAKALSPSDYDLTAEHAEHVWQMNLLGDPMLRLSRPQPMQLHIPEQAAPGDTILATGKLLASGKLTVELAFRREQVRRELNSDQASPHTDAGRELLQQRYRDVNDGVIVVVHADHAAGDIQVPIALPADIARGKYSVRSYLEGSESWHVGYSEIAVRP